MQPSFIIKTIKIESHSNAVNNTYTRIENFSFFWSLLNSRILLNIYIYLLHNINNYNSDWYLHTKNQRSIYVWFVMLINRLYAIRHICLPSDIGGLLYCVLKKEVKTSSARYEMARGAVVGGDRGGGAGGGGRRSGQPLIDEPNVLLSFDQFIWMKLIILNQLCIFVQYRSQFGCPRPQEALRFDPIGWTLGTAMRRCIITN